MTNAHELIDRVSLSWIDRYRPQSQSTDWGQSLAMYGLLRGYRKTGNERVREYLRTWLAFHASEGVHVNYFCGSWSFGLLYPDVVEVFPEIQIQARATAERIYSFIRDTALRNGKGVLLHNVDLPNIYIDTVYYSAVVLTKLGAFLGREWQDDALHQVAAHLEILRDGEKPFFIHCEENIQGLRSEGSWARGNGWVMMTFAELLGQLNATQPRAWVEAQFRDLSVALIGHQTPDGLWRTLVDDPESYEETSASAMYLFALKRAANAGVTHPLCEAAMERAYMALERSIDSRGAFVGSSEGTWPGTAEYYKSLNRGEWWWGTGAYLLALSEFA